MIDVHAHLYQTRAQALALKSSYDIDEYGQKQDIHFSSSYGLVEELVSSMTRTGITRTVVLNLFISSPGAMGRVEQSPGREDGSAINHDPDSAYESIVGYNEWLYRLTTQYSQLIPFVSIDPAVIAGRRAAAYLRGLVEDGKAAGVKLHPNLHGVDPAAETLVPLYAMCEQLGVPVLCHSGPAHGGHGGAVPSAFAPVLERFPRLTVVLAHLGGAAWKQSSDVARSFDNVYFDCAEILAWLGASRGPTALQLAALIQEVGSDRVLFGSDYPWYEQSDHVVSIQELPALSDAEKAQILGHNAARLLHI